MTATEKKLYLREKRWAESRRAESRGDYKKALKIHKEILAEDGGSYAFYLRSGWLSYRLGAFEEALHFYEQAREISDDEGPLQGIKNCLAALGDAGALTKVGASVSGTRNLPSVPSLHKPKL